MLTQGWTLFGLKQSLVLQVTLDVVFWQWCTLVRAWIHNFGFHVVDYMILDAEQNNLEIVLIHLWHANYFITGGFSCVAFLKKWNKLLFCRNFSKDLNNPV